jgi:hypothetical protein
VPLAVLAAVQGLAVGAAARESLLLDVETYAKYLLTLPLKVKAV